MAKESSRKNNTELRRRAEKALDRDPDTVHGMSTIDIQKLVQELNVHQIELEMQNAELRRIQLELQEARDKYIDLFDFAPIGYFTLDSDLLIRDVNLAGSKLLGIEKHRLIREQFTAFISPDSQDTFYLYCRKVLKTGIKGDCELKMLKADGTLIYVQMISMVVLDKNGNQNHYKSAIIDITEHKNEEQLLKRSEIEFRSLAESIPQIVWVTRPDGLNIYFNQKWMDYTGLTLEESLGQGWNKPFHPEDQQRAWDAWQRATQHNEKYSLECRLRRYDGTYRWWLIRGVPIIGTDGEILKWFGTCTDIEDIKQTESSLRESKEQYRSLFNHMTNGFAYCKMLFDVDNQPLDFIYLDVNDAFEKLTGLKKENVIDKNATQAIPGIKASNPDLFTSYGKVAATGIPASFEVFFKPLDIWLDISVYSPQKPYFVALFSNITERKRAEAQIIELETLKRSSQIKSELLANVSHELRTPLASIKGFLESLIETDVKWSESQKLDFLLSANKETDRLTFLIKDLLDMSRIDSGKLTIEKRPCQVSEVLKSVDGVLSVIANKHQIEINVAPGLPSLQLDRVRIGQVITNLVENASKFSPEGSHIVISAILKEKDVIISIQDQGMGMPGEVIANLFNRFFQAKEVASGKTRGTGLGLSICKGIVEAHGGLIWAESQVGKGSIFTFSLPVV